MPIHAVTYKIICDISTAGIVPKNPHILELGESNWYGDVPLQQLEQDIRSRANSQELKTELLVKLSECRSKLAGDPPRNEPLWELSKIFYKAVLDFASYTAVDLNGSGNALKYDLNAPIVMDRQYEMVIDFGTAEHVFNVLQVFKTVHEVTLPRGFMLHGLPFHGWIDHGFYNFQPTFFLDLAAANGYDVRMLLYRNMQSNEMTQIKSQDQISQLFDSSKVAGSGSLFVIYQKAAKETEFCVPMQGFYAERVSETVKDAWHKNR
jgi:hypothetical protein